MTIANASNPKRRPAERGFALISAIFALTVALLLLMTVSVQTLNAYRTLTLRLTYQGQALSTANAGLVEGLDWFRRQPGTILAFSPTRNLNPTPPALPVDDTDVVTNPPSITRDYLISQPGDVWGHYVVPRGTLATSTGVIDVTQARRGTSAPVGAMWQLQSTGYVYIRRDPAVAFNVKPNIVLATKTVRTEIQRVALNVKNAAISITTGGRVSIGNTGTAARVIGTSAGNGVVFNTAGTSPVNPQVTSPAVLSGTPGAYSSGLGTSEVTLYGVFNVNNLADLGAIADINVTNTNLLPSPLPAMQLIVLNYGGTGTATFDSSRPLSGSGILVVNGNLTINGGISAWNGVIYVTGNYIQSGPSSVYGAVIMGSATSTASINGTAPNFAEIYYDPFMVEQVGIQLGQFKFSRSAYVPCPSTDVNCNSRFSER
jgi:hypothetical protein